MVRHTLKKHRALNRMDIRELCAWGLKFESYGSLESSDLESENLRSSCQNHIQITHSRLMYWSWNSDWLNQGTEEIQMSNPNLGSWTSSFHMHDSKTSEIHRPWTSGPLNKVFFTMVRQRCDKISSLGNQLLSFSCSKYILDTEIPLLKVLGHSLFSSHYTSMSDIGWPKFGYTLHFEWIFTHFMSYCWVLILLHVMYQFSVEIRKLRYY